MDFTIKVGSVVKLTGDTPIHQSKIVVSKDALGQTKWCYEPKVVAEAKVESWTVVHGKLFLKLMHDDGCTTIANIDRVIGVVDPEKES